MSAMPSAEAFSRAAEDLVGVRFHHHGRTRAGVDCVGLAFLAAAEVGVVVPEFADYRPTPSEEVLVRELGLRCKVAPWEWRTRAGVLLLLRQTAGIAGQRRHVAIGTGNGNMVHAHSGYGRVQIDVLALDDRLCSVWGLNGICYEGGC